MTLRNKLTACCLKYLFYLILILFNISLVQAKKNIRPSWVDTHLSDPDYYTGIGYAPKVKKQNSYIDNAKKEALNELASEISIDIYSSNILVTIVKNDKLKDEFNTLIQSKVKTEIEDYELYSTFEDKKGYWVYCRLSKEIYRKNQLLKQTAATDNAHSYYLLAVEAEKKMEYKKAIVLYAKTIDAVKLYLNENIVVKINGEDENLVVRSFERIASILGSLRIEAKYNQINALFSSEISSEKLSFCLKNIDNKVVSDFPLFAVYSERAIPESNKITDDNGIVQFSIPKIRSFKKEEIFQVGIDINAILLESSADYIIRKAILEMPTQSETVGISIRKPSITLMITENNLGRRLESEVSGLTLKNLCLNAGYELLPANGDFKCVISTDTELQSEMNGIFTCALSGNIALIDKTEKIKYSTNILPVKGIQLSPEKAGLEACKKFVEQIETRYFREIEDAILK